MQAMHKITTQEIQLAQPLPKSGGLPLTDAIPKLIRENSKFFFDAWREFGDIYQLDLGSLSIVIVNHPDYAQHILRDNFSNYGKADELSDNSHTVVGSHMIENDTLKKHSKALQLQTHPEYLTNMIVSAIDDCFIKWDQFAESGEAFDVSIALEKVTMTHIERTLRWGLYQLACNQEIAQGLVQSVDNALGGELPKYSDIPKLGYAYQVMQEMMRLYPTVHFIPRFAINRDIIGGYRIQAGQLIFVMPPMIHRHLDYWDHPDVFDPERFASNDDYSPHPLAYIPFGADQHNGIDQELALIEGTLILTQLAQRYRVHAIENFELSRTLKSKDSAWITITKR